MNISYNNFFLTLDKYSCISLCYLYTAGEFFSADGRSEAVSNWCLWPGSDTGAIPKNTEGMTTSLFQSFTPYYRIQQNANSRGLSHRSCLIINNLINEEYDGSSTNTACLWSVPFMWGGNKQPLGLFDVQ